MDKVCLLATETVLRDDWKSRLPGPKLGNTKDPDKIAKKMEEWEQTAQQEALNNRFASKITSFFMRGDGWEVKGLNGKQFVNAYNEKCANDETVVLALNARSKVSQLALQASMEGVRVPEVLLCKSYTSGGFCRNGKIVDPIAMIGMSTEEPGEVAEFLGLRKNILRPDCSIEDQLSALALLSDRFIF